MSRLTWSAVGERFYEMGVDRGVLYIGNKSVAWNGLTSVSESPTGGEAKAFYVDGIKYLNLSSAEEFEATIEAFSSPPEFGVCDGISTVQNGLYLGQQSRKSFGFSYRTKLGNDVAGPDYAYKIHLIYNALAAPSERAYNTLGDSSDPMGFSWSITTMPPVISGYKPTAHFVIDSRTTAPLRLSAFEDILYGSNSSAPRLPSAQELVDFFNNTDYPFLKVVSVGANAYEIHQVDVSSDARAVMQSTSPSAPAVGENPILWFDTSAGNYAIPKLVTAG